MDVTEIKNIVFVGVLLSEERVFEWERNGRLAEDACILTTCVLVCLLPLSRRTNHPLISEELAHGFSPAPVFSSGVGSRITFRDGWLLASLSC